MDFEAKDWNDPSFDLVSGFFMVILMLCLIDYLFHKYTNIDVTANFSMNKHGIKQNMETQF